MNRKYNVLFVMGLSLIALGAFLSHPRVNAADTVTPQPMSQVRIDVQKLSTGYRASKIIGSNVMNDANETVGKVDDLIVSPEDNKTAHVVLSVGGFLGMGDRLVAMPFDNLKMNNNRLTMPGATKDGLKAMPQFKYSAP